MNGRVRLLVAVVGFFLIGAVVLMLGPPSGDTDAPPSAVKFPSETSEERAPDPAPEGPLAGLARPEPQAEDPVRTPEPRVSEARWEGRGSIRGSVGVPRGVPFPARWSVEVGPSRSLVGRERAETRRLELTSDEREFAFEDLPLGGYDVRARAEGMNSLPLAVLLQRGSPDPYVSLELTPAGTLSGFVVDAELAPLEGLAVTLRATGPGGGAERVTRTDPAGRYVFERVLDGPYQLLVGHPANPVAPTKNIVFRAPSLHVPRIEVPTLGRVQVLVFDGNFQPVEGARVRGSGKNGGYVDDHTNERGEAWAHLLPAGRYRLYADFDGRTERTTFELSEGEFRQVEIRFEP